jgi:hypothetical protein
VYKDKEVFGKLLVSKGAVVRWKKWRSTRGQKLGWSAFDRLMNEHGRSVSGG